MSGRRVRSLLALLALLALVFLAGCADFPASPTVCITCEKGIENATAEGPNVSVETSELYIRVREDGTARWSVRANLTGTGVEKLRSNPGQVSRLARKSVTGKVGTVAPSVGIHGGNVSNISARMDDNVLVISFTVTDMAKQGFGSIILVDYFHTEGQGPASYLLGTNRVIIRGPPDTVVTEYPSNANVTDRGRAVVWRSTNTFSITGDTYVAFAPAHGHSTRLTTRITIVSDVASWAAPRAASVGFSYAVVVLVTMVLLSRWLMGRYPIRRVGRGDSVLARLVDRPPVDLPVVAVLYVSLIVGIFGRIGTSRTLASLFVFPPLGSIGLFFSLGMAVERYPWTSRFLTLAIGGAPFVMASTAVLELPQSNGVNSSPGSSLFIPVMLFLLTGIPAFYFGTRVWRFVAEVSDTREDSTTG